MNRGERSWMRGFDRANSEPGFSDEDGEASKFYPLRFNNSERERGRGRDVEVFRSVKRLVHPLHPWTKINTLSLLLYFVESY